MKLKLVFLFLLLGVMVYAAERLPGRSLADAVLQYDTLKAVYSSAIIAVPECKEDLSVVNTELISEPEFRNKRGKLQAVSDWAEKWTVNACGKEVSVPIVFIPDKRGTGTSFIVYKPNLKQ